MKPIIETLRLTLCNNQVAKKRYFVDPLASGRGADIMLIQLRLAGGSWLDDRFTLFHVDQEI